MKLYTRKKTALVLGGGAARGLAHLGILKVFRREKVKFDLVAGTSIGGLFAAIWALGLDLEEVEKRAVKLTAKDILDVTISRSGLCQGNKLEYLIKETLKNKQFDDIKMPLFIITTDIENGTSLVHSSGNLSEVIKASCSIPGIFRPVEIGGQPMIDGGITNNVPVSVVKKYGATHVLAADVGYCITHLGISNMLNVIMQSIQIMGDRLNKFETRQADVILRPQLDAINQTEFDRAAEIIKLGEVEAEKHIGKARRLAGKGPREAGIGFLWE